MPLKDVKWVTVPKFEELSVENVMKIMKDDINNTRCASTKKEGTHCIRIIYQQMTENYIF